MVAIRLSRTGAKKKPSYRVVVIDKRRARDSRNLEIVGHYNPREDPIEVVLKRDRIDYWLGVGAQPSKTVKRLVKHFDEVSPPEPEVEVEVVSPPQEEEVAAEATPQASLLPDEPGAPVEGAEEDGSEELDAQLEEAIKSGEI